MKIEVGISNDDDVVVVVVTLVFPGVDELPLNKGRSSPFPGVVIFEPSGVSNEEMSGGGIGKYGYFMSLDF